MNRRAFSRLLALAALPHSPLQDTRRLALWRMLTPGDDFNVRAFGAVGDGRTDDSQALQATVNAAAVRGGTVVVPAGQYRTTRTLRLASGVSLRGVFGASIVQRDGGDPITIYAGDVHDVAIEDLAISGSYAHGVLLERAERTTVRRCRMTGADQARFGLAAAVFIVGGANVTIEKCEFTGNGFSGPGQGADILCNGLGSTSQNIHILGNSCSSTAVAINVCCYDVAQSTLRNNTVTGARMHGLDNHGYGILVYQTIPNQGSCFENVVTGNRVSRTDGSGIYLAASNKTRVEDNEIQSAGSVQADLTLPVAGIALNQCRDMVIAGNRIFDAGHAGISIASSREGIGEIDVTRNRIERAAGFGIHLRGILRNVRVTDNDIRSTAGAIGTDTADPQDELEIVNNRISNIVGRPAIKLGNAARSHVDRNKIADSAGYAYDVTFRDAESTLMGNDIRNMGAATAEKGGVSGIIRRPKNP